MSKNKNRRRIPPQSAQKRPIILDETEQQTVARHIKQCEGVIARSKQLLAKGEYRATVAFYENIIVRETAFVARLRREGLRAYEASPQAQAAMQRLRSA